MPLVPNEGEDDESAAHRVENQAEIRVIKISSTLLRWELQGHRMASSGSKTQVCYLLTAAPNSLKIYLLVLQKAASQPNGVKQLIYETRERISELALHLD